jgi:hypothetical protein
MSTEGVGDRDRAVSQQVSHGLDVYSRLKRGHGGTMAQRVHPDVGHARFLRRDLNRPQDVARVDRRANPEANTSPWSCHWSPQQIAQWLRQEFREDVAMRISHESIYHDLYMPSRIVFDASMFHRLRTDRPIHGRSVSGPPTARPDPQHSLHPRASRRGRHSGSGRASRAADAGIDAAMRGLARSG